MVNELEIRAYLRRNDFEALGRVADWLAFDRHMTIADVFDLFERLGGGPPALGAGVPRRLSRG